MIQTEIYTRLIDSNYYLHLRNTAYQTPEFFVRSGSDSRNISSCSGSEIEMNCYTLYLHPLDWDSAHQHCRDRDSVLVAVYTPEIQNELREFLQGNNVTDPVWIGGRTENPFDLERNFISQWRWVYSKLASTIFDFLPYYGSSPKAH